MFPIHNELEALLDDAASLLRGAGLWTNTLSDRCVRVLQSLAALEARAVEQSPLPAVRRPFQTWNDFDAVLHGLIARPWGYESGGGYFVSPALLVWLARQSWLWREAGQHPPANFYLKDWGDLVVDFDAGKGAYLLTQAGGIFPGQNCPPLEPRLTKHDGA
jgi:hypothetical protein